MKRIFSYLIPCKKRMLLGFSIKVTGTANRMASRTTADFSIAMRVDLRLA